MRVRPFVSRRFTRRAATSLVALACVCTVSLGKELGKPLEPESPGLAEDDRWPVVPVRLVSMSAPEVKIDHPLRGVIILMTTDMDLDPLDAIVLYSHRFKIETGFRHAIHVLGSYAYYFWMDAMDPIRRRSGDLHLHMKSEG